MKTNSTKKMIAIAVLLLLAIGAGYLYTNHDRTSDNKVDAQSGTAASTSDGNAEMTPAPVATQAPAATDVAPAGDATQQSTAACTPVAVKRYLYSHKGHRRHKAAPSVADDDLSYVNASNYSGNMPAPAAPAINNSVAPANTTTSTVAPVPVQSANSAGKHHRNKESMGVGIAPEVGVNLNGLYHNNTANLLTNGFHAGLMVNVGLSDAFALQPGVEYIVKGNKDRSAAEVEGMQVNTTHNRVLNYVEVPVNVVYKFGDKKGNPRFMIGAGPYVSYLAGSKDKMEVATLNAEGFPMDKQDYNVNGTTGMNRLDYGVGGFVGCQLPRGFYAKAGTEWGLRNVDRESANGKAADRNYNYLLSVGYILGPKNKEY